MGYFTLLAGQRVFVHFFSQLFLLLTCLKNAALGRIELLVEVWLMSHGADIRATRLTTADVDNEDTFC